MPDVTLGGRGRVFVLSIFPSPADGRSTYVITKVNEMFGLE